VPWSAAARLLSSLRPCTLCHPRGEKEREQDRDSSFPNTCFIETALFLVMLHRGCRQLKWRMVLTLCPGHATSWKDITGRKPTRETATSAPQRRGRPMLHPVQCPVSGSDQHQMLPRKAQNTHRTPNRTARCEKESSSPSGTAPGHAGFEPL